MRQIILDTETTGLDPAMGHRIIEIAAVEVINRKITDRHFQRYVNPEREIDEGAKKVHGITELFLSDKPKFRDVLEDFLSFISGAELIIHNAPFDLSFLNQELQFCKRENIDSYINGVLDSLVMARELHPGKRNSLDALCDRYKIDNSKETKICISSSTVKALIDGMTTNAIQIGESLLENNLGEALMRLNALLETGEPPLRILATVTSQVRGWLWISLLEQQRESDVSIIAKAAGINNPKRVYILRKQLKGKSPKRFLQLLNCLLEIESAIKRGVMPEDAFRDGLLSDHCFE